MVDGLSSTFGTNLGVIVVVNLTFFISCLACIPASYCLEAHCTKTVKKMRTISAFVLYTPNLDWSKSDEGRLALLNNHLHRTFSFVILKVCILFCIIAI